jgi:hypothetical protein
VKKIKTITKNATLLKLKGTPFKNAGEMKLQEEKILREEWQTVERARVRRDLLMKEQNVTVLSPFLNGFGARFTGHADADQNLIRVYMTKDEAVQVDIDNRLKGQDVDSTLESLVKSLVDGLMSGYLAALGLRDFGLQKPGGKK